MPKKGKSKGASRPKKADASDLARQLKADADRFKAGLREREERVKRLEAMLSAAEPKKSVPRRKKLVREKSRADITEIPEYVRSEFARQVARVASLKVHARRRERDEKEWQALQKNLPKFKKGDVGKLLFLALPTAQEKKRGIKYVTQGLNGRRKSFMAYVNRNKKLTVVTFKGKASYARPITFKGTEVLPKYVAKKYYAQHFNSLYPEKVNKKGETLKDSDGVVMREYPCMNGVNISWDRVVERITAELKYMMDFRFPRSDINFKVRFREAIVENEDGIKFNFTSFDGVEFKSRAMQEYRAGGLENYTSKKMYAHFAAMLSKHDLVTVGSAAHIYRYYNSNRSVKSRRNWVNAAGKLWEKNEFALVKIRHICFDIETMRREYSKESVGGYSIDSETG